MPTLLTKLSLPENFYQISDLLDKKEEELPARKRFS
jgi:hypothetical protein